VPQTPDLKPYEDIDPSELMTWGTIVDTPVLLESGKYTGHSYQIPPTPQRELLANKLSEKASSSIRKRTNTPKRTPLRNSPALQHLQKQLHRGMGFTILKRQSTPRQTPKSITDDLLNL
jgi:protein DGCR14